MVWECLSLFATPAWRRSAPDALRVGGDGVPDVGGGDLEQRAVKYGLVVLSDGVNECRQREHDPTTLPAASRRSAFQSIEVQRWHNPLGSAGSGKSANCRTCEPQRVHRHRLVYKALSARQRK